MAEGADIVVEDAAALARRFPWLSTEGIAAGAYGRTGEGWFDAHALSDAVPQGGRGRRTSTFVTASVAGIERDGARVTAVTLDNGERLEAGIVVNAAGPNAGRVSAMAGIRAAGRAAQAQRLRLRGARKIRRHAAAGRPVRHLCAAGRLGLHHRWRRIRGERRAADPADFEPDWPLFEDVIWPVLATRIPAFEAIKADARLGRPLRLQHARPERRGRASSGRIGNFLFANGFSGHGLQQAPAVGRALAELVMHGGYRTVDCSAFGYERIAAGRPFRELNVI
jgi:FAD-dependent oxidoreductase domain-containing protein 1